MQTLNKNITQHWEIVDQAITRFLDERQELILLVLSAIDPANESHSLPPLKEKLKNVFEVLVDYVSAGHFEIYDELLKEGAIFRDKALDYAKDLLPELDDSTDFVLNLNDEMERIEENKLSKRQVNSRLENLLTKLEDRFEIEDKLLKLLHFNHEALINSPTNTQPH